MYPLLALTALCGLAVASVEVSLQELLVEARTANPLLRAQDATVAARALSVGPAGALEDPMVLLQLWNAPADLGSLPVMLEVTQPFLLGGKRQARRAAATAAARLARAERQGQGQALDLAVVQAWADIWLAEQSLAVNAQLAASLTALRLGAAARVAGGVGDTAEVLRAELETVALESSDAEMQALRRGSQGRLLGLLNRPLEDRLAPLRGPEILLALPPESALQAEAQTQRPEVLRAAAEVEGAVAAEQLAAAAGVPDIAPRLGLMHTFRNPTGPSNFLFLGLQGTLPVWRQSKVQPLRAAAAAQGHAASHSELGMRRRIAAEVTMAYAQVEAQAAAVSAHARMVPQAQELLDNALASFVSGRGKFAAVLEAARSLQQHALDRLRHLAAYATGVAVLDLAVGASPGLAGQVDQASFDAVQSPQPAGR